MMDRITDAMDDRFVSENLPLPGNTKRRMKLLLVTDLCFM